MTKEERAEQSRINGAKSRGPVSAEGKARSSRNALKDGQHADALKHLLPPHEVVLCNEDRQEYYNLVERLLATYKPANEAARQAVGDIAAARWQISRLNICLTMSWNLALLDHGRAIADTAGDLIEAQAMLLTAKDLLNPTGLITRLNREIRHLQRFIAAAERRIHFLHTHFQNEEERTQPDQPQPAETKQQPVSEPIIIEGNEPAVFTTENTPDVINYYKTRFPGRKIVILPPDDPDNGDPYQHDYGTVPRNAA
jgi:hypothetical protein